MFIPGMNVFWGIFGVAFGPRPASRLSAVGPGWPVTGLSLSPANKQQQQPQQQERATKTRITTTTLDDQQCQWWSSLVMYILIGWHWASIKLGEPQILGEDQCVCMCAMPASLWGEHLARRGAARTATQPWSLKRCLAAYRSTQSQSTQQGNTVASVVCLVGWLSHIWLGHSAQYYCETLATGETGEWEHRHSTRISCLASGHQAWALHWLGRANNTIIQDY